MNNKALHNLEQIKTMIYLIEFYIEENRPEEVLEDIKLTEYYLNCMKKEIKENK